MNTLFAINGPLLPGLARVILCGFVSERPVDVRFIVKFITGRQAMNRVARPVNDYPVANGDQLASGIGPAAVAVNTD